MADKCPFSHLCKYYKKDAFVCNVNDFTENRFCGAYKQFFAKRLTNKMDEMIGSLSFVSKSELYGP